MSSRSTKYRHLKGDHINSVGSLAMVACKACHKGNLVCKMSSLSTKCGNCERRGIKICDPLEPPLPNFSRLDKEMDRLARMEEEAELAEEKAMEALQAARAKLLRLRKQRRFLKRKEQRLFDETSRHVEELEVLEGREALNDDITSLDAGLLAGSLALDWSVFPPPFDPNTLESTFSEAVGMS